MGSLPQRAREWLLTAEPTGPPHRWLDLYPIAAVQSRPAYILTNIWDASAELLPRLARLNRLVHGLVDRVIYVGGRLRDDAVNWCQATSNGIQPPLSAFVKSNLLMSPARLGFEYTHSVHGVVFHP